MMKSLVFAMALALVGGQLGPATTPPPLQPPSPEQLRDAFVSIMVHSYPDELSQFPFEVIPLNAAMQFVARTTGTAAAYDQRWAIVNLSVGNFADGSIKRETVAALKILKAPIPKIIAAMQDLPASVPRRRMEQAVFRVLADEGLGETCASSVTTDTGHDQYSDSAIAAFRVVGVPRSLSKVARALDPQNWSQCFGPWITESYVAKDHGSGNYLPPTENPSPPTPATSWEDVLFEEWSNADIDVEWLTNLFDVDARRTTTMYYYEYALYESLELKLMDADVAVERPMQRNDGYMSARKKATGVIVTGLKVLRYRPSRDGDPPAYNPSQYNALAPYYLQLIGDAVEKAVCTCEPEMQTSPGLWWYEILEWISDWIFGT